MHLLFIIVIGIVFLATAMTFAWCVVRATDNGGLADVIWTVALGICGLFYCYAAPDLLHSRALISSLAILLWTVRLGVPLWRRNVGGAEDARYTALRQQWGKRFWLHLFGLLMLQAAAAFLLTLGIVLAAENPSPLGALDTLGIFIMGTALWGGYQADAQLASFKKSQDHGPICNVGLWGRSRHPNYFFEVMFWAGWPLLALSGGWWPGILALVAPVFMYWLLRYISGEPLVEANMARRYGEIFEQYKRDVPPFFPRLFNKR